MPQPPDYAALYDEILAEDEESELRPLAYSVLQENTADGLKELDCIGEGAIKTITKCYDPKSKRYVALARPKEARHYDLLTYEAWVLSRLDHPNIIPLYDLGLDAQDAPYFTMALREHQNLEDYLTEQKPSTRERLQLVLPVCDAIAYAHQQHLVHLDIKPENVLCSPTGQISVCDWGLAEFIKMDGTISFKSEQHLHVYADDPNTGEIKGTPGYMAPEQILDNSLTGIGSDLFSLGALLYHLLTGEPPFTGSLRERIAQTKACYLPPIQETLSAHKVDPGLIAIILKCLAPDQAHRYRSAPALIADLHRHLDGYTTEAEQRSPVLSLRRFVRRHPVRCAMAAGFLLTSTVASAWFIMSLQQKNHAYAAAQLDQVAAQQQASDLQAYSDAMQDVISQSSEVQQGVMEVVHDYVYRADTYKEYSKREQDVRRILERMLANELIEIDAAGFFLDYTHAVRLDLSQLRPNTRLWRHFQPYPDLVARGEGARPSQSALDHYFSQTYARALPEYLAPILPRLHQFMVAYDHSLDRPGISYLTPVLCLLQAQNAHSLNIDHQYYPHSITLCSSSSQHPLKLLRHLGNESLLSYLDVKKIRLISEKPLDLSMLQGCTCEELDLSQVSGLRISATTVNLPKLQAVIISSQEDQNYVRKYIRSEQAFNIIVR